MSAPWLALAVEALTAPLLIRQGKRLRRRIPRLPEPDGERSGARGSGEPLRLMIAGDSAAAGVGVATQSHALSGRLVERLSRDRCVHWQLHARTGFRTPDVTALLADVPEQKIDALVMSLGLNDTLSRTSGDRFLAQQNALLDAVARRFSPALVVLTAIPPLGDFPGFPQPLRWVMHARRNWLDAQLQRLCRERGDCVHLELQGPLLPADMASDGFHPGERIYAAWADAAADVIRSGLESRRGAA